jgi:protein TonB
VEFVLDDEAMRVIEQSPLWQPAFQDGKNVNAYRVQPFTFIKP